MKHIQRRSDCPISFGLDIFGDKWTLLIMRDILVYNRTRFSDFTPQERIATNILSDRLTRLESSGFIVKKRDENLKNQYVYSATDKGLALVPMLIESMLWGFVHDGESIANAKYKKRILSNRGQVILEINKSLSEGTFLQYRTEKMGIKPNENRTLSLLSQNTK